MTIETFKEILNTKSMTFTAQEIMGIIDEELEKEPSEMDTGLIELCLDALNIGQ